MEQQTQKHLAEFNADDPFIRIADVERQTGLKKSTIYSLISRGEFPSPISLGQRASGWLLSEIHQWKQQRIALSRGSRDGEQK